MTSGYLVIKNELKRSKSTGNCHSQPSRSGGGLAKVVQRFPVFCYKMSKTGSKGIHVHGLFLCYRIRCHGIRRVPREVIFYPRQQVSDGLNKAKEGRILLDGIGWLRYSFLLAPNILSAIGSIIKNVDNN